jgi:hypothetical protein
VEDQESSLLQFPLLVRVFDILIKLRRRRRWMKRPRGGFDLGVQSQSFRGTGVLDRRDNSRIDVSVHIARRHNPTVQERQQSLALGSNIVDIYVRPAPVFSSPVRIPRVLAYFAQ